MTGYKSDIRKFIVDNFLFGQDNGLSDEASFLEKGVIDSTGVLELVSHIESAYSVKIADSELLPENLDSINAVASFLEKKLGNSTAAGKPTPLKS